MDDDKSLADYGLTAAVAKAQQPAEVGLAFRGDDGAWEELEKTPYSIPPELPDVMKPGQDKTWEKCDLVDKVTEEQVPADTCRDNVSMTYLTVPKKDRS